MNILSYIHVNRLPNPSGVGRVIDRLIAHHVDQYPDASHRILVAKDLYDQCYAELDDFWKKISFIPFKGRTSWTQAQWIWKNHPYAEQYWEDVDVVYCPAESYVPTRKAGLVCTIHDVAGFEEDLYPSTLSNRMHRLKWSMMFRRMAEHADAVVTVSSFSASRIAHFFPGLENKLRVIYNAPHYIFGSPVSEEMKKKVDDVTLNSPYVLVPGGLSLRKNADLVLRTIALIAQKMPEIKVVIAGSSSPEYKEKLKAAKYANIIQTGYVSDEMLNALYSSSALVWFPSRYEGFGMPVIEAMSAGAPVVASNAASIPEIAGRAALLCDMDSASEHLDAIHSIIDSPARRDEMSRVGRTHAKKFNWRSAAEQLEDIFQSTK